MRRRSGDLRFYMYKSKGMKRIRGSRWSDIFWGMTSIERKTASIDIESTSRVWDQGIRLCRDTEVKCSR